MIKRNDGYALSYVLVVLLVLCAIAITVMSVSLNNLKNQQRSIARMQERYAAQGLVEQVIAQLEASTDSYVTIPSDYNEDTENPYCKITSETGVIPVEYEIIAKHQNTSIRAKFSLSEIKETINETETIIGHKVQYLTYDVTYVPSDEEVAP